jgi:hypothetical protein
MAVHPQPQHKTKQMLLHKPQEMRLPERMPLHKLKPKPKQMPLHKPQETQLPERMPKPKPKQQRKQPKLHSKHQKEAPAIQVAVGVAVEMAMVAVEVHLAINPQPHGQLCGQTKVMVVEAVMLEAATYKTGNSTNAWPVVGMYTALCALLLRFSKMANTAFIPRRCTQMAGFLTPTT